MGFLHSMRFHRRRLCKAIAFFIALFLIVHIFVDSKLHPQNYVWESDRLSAFALPVFSWVDYEMWNEPGTSFFRPADREVSPLNRFVLSPSKPCRENPFIAALVASPPQDIATRDLIRNTWASAVRTRQWPHLAGDKKGEANLDVTVDVFFVIGLSGAETNGTEKRRLVEQEARKHDDLIVGDFQDTYKNLTRKILTGLNWVSEHCPGTAFVLKVDQDTLVDFPRLVAFLRENVYQTRNSVIGKLYHNSKRLDTGKWMGSRQEYPFNYYPLFAGGPCYLISTDAVARIVNASRFFPVFPLEDVHVTGILAREVGVQHLYMHQLRNFFSDGDSPCAFVQRPCYQVSMTELTPDKLRHVWQILTTGECKPFPQSYVNGE